MAWGLLAGLVLQAPLGWWTLRAIGTDRFLAMWGLGMLVRLAVVAIAALVQIPALGDAATRVATMVGILVALLLIEGVVAMREQSGKTGDDAIGTSGGRAAWLVAGRPAARWRRRSTAGNQIDIAHHLANSHEVETPFGVLHLPRWDPLHIGSLAIDLSPTKHLVYMLLAAPSWAWFSC